VGRSATIDGATARDGGTGRLVFVKVRHGLRRNGAAVPALVAFHDIVNVTVVEGHPGRVVHGPLVATLR
jgi:hydroxyacyl-ACP dehydratase HTD2-like protein with hotdog domain